MEEKELEFEENAAEEAREEEAIEKQEAKQKELDEAEVVASEEKTPNEIRKAKREERKAKRRAKLRHKYIEGPDAKFKQPLTYRYLRALAWLFILVAQLVIIFKLANKINTTPVFNEPTITALSAIGALATPLFLIATFSIILNGSKTFKSMLIIYGAGYVGLGLVGIFAYYHYINPLFMLIMEDTTGMDTLMGDLVGQKIQFNVFADLFALTVVSFFLNYTPKKYFQGKKLYIFRFMVLIPLLLLAGGYIVKIFTKMDGFSIPFWAYIFLPTKSPVVHMLFLCVSLWVKNRKKLFMKIGGTEEQYKVYLKSNRNSIDFSKQLSILILVFVVIDFFLFIFVSALYLGNMAPEVQQTQEGLLYAMSNANSIGLGEAMSLLLIVPVIMLFSYTKTHKNKKIDTLMPAAAIGVIKANELPKYTGDFFLVQII